MGHVGRDENLKSRIWLFNYQEMLLAVLPFLQHGQQHLRLMVSFRQFVWQDNSIQLDSMNFTWTNFNNRVSTLLTCLQRNA